MPQTARYHTYMCLTAVPDFRDILEDLKDAFQLGQHSPRMAVKPYRLPGDIGDKNSSDEAHTGWLMSEDSPSTPTESPRKAPKASQNRRTTPRGPPRKVLLAPVAKPAEKNCENNSDCEPEDKQVPLVHHL